MTKIEIAVKAKELKENHVAHYGDASESNKAHFGEFYKLVQATKTRKTAVLALAEAAKSIDLESSKREFISMVKMAVVFADMQGILNLSAITWENLKRGVKLYTKVSKNFSADELAEMKELLADVWEKAMSSFRYNNNLEVTFKNLNEKYTKVVVESHEKVLERVLVEIDILTREELESLIQTLQLALETKAELTEEEIATAKSDEEAQAEEAVNATEKIAEETVLETEEVSA